MHLPLKSVRSLIGYCPQDNFLFSDTVKSNISFADENLTENQIKDAAEFSDVSNNIEDFKDKYDTLIGEKGVSLSGGQKQRISISRAIIKDPTILVLDDSVSAVDVKTEENILKNIKKERKNKTTILIASRVSTIRNLDKIIVMNEGKVEAFGTHEECLKNSKTYARMVELQLLEKEMDGD
jgi:ATP-binding cassette subfamily B protein